MEPAILSEKRQNAPSGPEIAWTETMKKEKSAGAPGASSAEEVEKTERQPGRKGRPGDPPAAPGANTPQETGTGAPPPGNNSAPAPRR